jgi:methylenetetrahydrofolate dehydrogenase (NADP+)/methenyltetrahydrofolate cyclohydrolase
MGNEPQLLEGNIVADHLLLQLHQRIKEAQRPPHLALLRVGDDPASVLYVKRKSLIAQKVGIATTIKLFPCDTDRQVVLQQINNWNVNPHIDGILVQAPLPSMDYQSAMFQALDAKKDVDGFHPINVGKLVCEDSSGFVPCTPKGVIKLLGAYDIPLDGRHVVVIGRSLIVGKPLATLLLSRKINATVTVCHSKSKNLASITRSAHVVISAVGQTNLITADMISPGTVVVDVGQNRIPSTDNPGKFCLCGDVDFHGVAPLCSYITPVPGGVGPMTIAMLMENVVEAYFRNEGHFCEKGMGN